jgi:hypothetical protein
MATVNLRLNMRHGEIFVSVFVTSEFPTLLDVYIWFTYVYTKRFQSRFVSILYFPRL